MATIRLRGKTWYVDYYYQGKRHVKAISKHKRLAELTLKDIEVKIAKKEHLGIHEQNKILLKTFTKKYLEYSKANKRPKSYERDVVNLKHLNAYFENYHLHEIRPELIEKYKAERLEKVSPASVNRELATLKNMYTKAIQWEYVKDNPAKTVKLLKEPPGRLRYLEKEEIKKLIDSCAPHLKPIVIMALNTGMRRGEILNLKWSDISLKNRNILVRNSKSNTSRIIPMNDTVYKTLKSTPKKGEYLFNLDGNKIGDIKKSFKNALKRAGIEGFRFHDLRHTFASHLAMLGCNLKTIQELLGHKDIKMTFRYAHLTQSNLRETVQKLVTNW